MFLLNKVSSILSYPKASIIVHNICSFFLSSIISLIGFILGCLWWFYQNFFPYLALLWFYFMRRHEAYLKKEYLLKKGRSLEEAAKLSYDLHIFRSSFYTYCWVILAIGVFLSVADYCINELHIFDNLFNFGDSLSYYYKCHLFPSVNYPNPYKSSYVNYHCHSFKYISSLNLSFSSFYPYQVFGSFDSYTTSLTFKVPYFIHDSKLFVYIG